MKGKKKRQPLHSCHRGDGEGVTLVTVLQAGRRQCVHSHPPLQLLQVPPDQPAQKLPSPRERPEGSQPFPCTAQRLGRYANACPLGGDSGPDKAGRCAPQAAVPTTFGAFGGATVLGQRPHPGLVGSSRDPPPPSRCSANLGPPGGSPGWRGPTLLHREILPQRILGESFKQTRKLKDSTPRLGPSISSLSSRPGPRPTAVPIHLSGVPP